MVMHSVSALLIRVSQVHLIMRGNLPHRHCRPLHCGCQSITLQH